MVAAPADFGLPASKGGAGAYLSMSWMTLASPLFAISAKSAAITTRPRRSPRHSPILPKRCADHVREHFGAHVYSGAFSQSVRARGR